MSTEPEKIIYSMIGVSKTYNNKAVIKDISLSYFYGAKIGVLGLNGSGKGEILKFLEERSFYSYSLSDVIRERLAGISPMNVVIEATGDGSVASPEVTAGLAGLTTRCRQRLPKQRSIS